MKNYRGHKDELVIYLDRVIAGGIGLLALMGIVNIITVLLT